MGTAWRLATPSRPSRRRRLTPPPNPYRRCHCRFNCAHTASFSSRETAGSGSPRKVCRLCLRLFQHLPIANQVGHTKLRQARLARAEELSRSAQPQVEFRQLEAILSTHHGLQPCLALLGDLAPPSPECRSSSPRRARRVRAVGAVAPARSAPRVRSPSHWRSARPRRPRSP